MFSSGRKSSNSSVGTSASKISKKDVKAMSAKDPLSGRPGHLDDAQEHAVEVFREKIQKEGLFEKERHDEACICRFLRARKWDQAAAFEMFNNAEKWRKDFKVDELYESFDYPEKEKVDEIYPQYYHKTDKDGRPVYIEQLGKLDLKKLWEVTTPERQIQKLVVEYEKFQRERLPICTANKGELVETSCTIMDLKNVGVSQFWKVSSYVQEASNIGTLYYPETMGKFYIINAPYVFSMVWNVVRSWLDPVTVAKIKILGSGYESELMDQVPAENLPKTLGGKCTCDDAGGCSMSDAGPWNTPEGKELLKKIQANKDEHGNATHGNGSSKENGDSRPEADKQ